MPDNAAWERLSRYLAGEISDEEKRRVEEWLREDPAHRELLDSLERIWQASEIRRERDIPSAEEMDADRERLLQSIRDSRRRPSDRQPNRSKRRGARRLLSPLRSPIARVVMVLLLVIGGIVIATQMQSGQNTASSEQAFELIKTARGERATIRLPDSTKVQLSVDTELRVPNNFGKTQREVQLDGEAYFDVVPDSDRPFIVRSGSARVQVLGTAFGVTAYASDSTVQVVVREGRVAFGNEDAAEDRRATLRRNDLGLLSGSAQEVTTRRVDSEDYLSWVNDRLVFSDAPLPEVARRLERWYDVRVQLADSNLADRRLTATFDNVSAGSAADIISATLGIEHRLEDREIVFTTRMKGE